MGAVSVSTHLCPSMECALSEHKSETSFAETHFVDYAGIASAHRIAARIVDSAANVVSGYGAYGLANELWAFGSGLRRKAEWWQAGASTEPGPVEWGVRWHGTSGVTICEDEASANDLAAMTEGETVTRDRHLLTDWAAMG